MIRVKYFIMLLVAGALSSGMALEHGYNIFGYFTSWGVYERDYLVRDIPAEKLTHINFAFLAPFMLPGEYNQFDSIPKTVFKMSDGASPAQNMYVIGAAQCTISNVVYSVGLAVDDVWACFQKTDFTRRYQAAPAYGRRDDPYDSWDKPAFGGVPGPGDRTAGIFGELLGLRTAHPHIKILASIGGWTYSYYFSELAADSASRTAFAMACKQMLDLFLPRGDMPQLFDGVDLDWEFPYTGGDIAVSHRTDDRGNFTALARSLRETLGVEPLLTIATAQDYRLIKFQYEADLLEYLDFILIMAYDYCGVWASKTGVQAPLYGGDRNDPLYNPDDGKYMVISEVVAAFIDQGFDPAGIVLGMPFYGRSYGNVNNANSGLYQPFRGAGIGSYEQGMVDFNDLVDGLRGNQALALVNGAWVGINGYVRHWDGFSQTPFLFNGNCMVTYDDNVSLGAKVGFAMNQGLGGVMIWELSCDTRFDSTTPHLLLNAVDQALRRPLSPESLSATKGALAEGIYLVWQASAGADAYEVWRHNSIGFDRPALVNIVSGTQYTDRSVDCNMTYYYRLKAVNRHGASAFSEMDAGYALSPDVSGGMDIRINNLPNDLVRMRRGEILSLTSMLVLSHDLQIDADWWMLAETPLGVYRFDQPAHAWCLAGGVAPA
ncbi:MAG: hypothetical protein LC725_05250 [Lentisphaerae bacterium]|nr:hypothetical protein [Lentisphaerota bacterium]